MEDHPGVTVLLSSYNGAKYIEDQVRSILTQRGVRVWLVIRDDGSTDKTPEILTRLAGEHDNISIRLKENVGFIKSFFDLLKNADVNSEFYSFSDQDDIWLPDKLVVGVSALSIKSDTPAMYCSRTEYVNASLRHLSFSPAHKPQKIGFGNALVQNVATGCTIILNGDARKLIVENLPESCLAHDWWVYLVVSAFGSVIYDQAAHIKYRQHGGNVVGASSSFITNAIKRTRRFFGSLRDNKTSSQITEFNRIFKSKMTPDQVSIVEKILRANRNMLGRISLVCRGFYWRQNLVDDFLLRVVILAGRF